MLSINLLSDDLLLLASILVFFAIMTTKIGARFGVPSLLLFLVLGMVAGEDGLGVRFQDYELAESIGHFAMTIILFSGGLQTSMEETRPVMKQGILLASVGVIIASLLTGWFIYLVAGNAVGALGSSLIGCLLVAVIMASTDSASVFGLLHGKRLHLRHDLAPLLELESGSNDPMAYVLTIIITGFLSTGNAEVSMGMLSLRGGLVFLVQTAIGLLVGFLVGKLTVWIIKKVNLPGSSLYSILVLSSAFFASGLASVVYGNGLLALYVAAIIIGNQAPIPGKKDVLKFFDGMTWLMQLLMFLVLGLLARPSQMPHMIVPALLVGLFLIFVARPVSVLVSLLPFRKMPFKAKIFTSWVGIKGAGPILFALYPVVHEVEGASDIFNMVFLISLLSLLVQGMTLAPVAKWLGLSYEEDPPVESFGLELPEEMGMLRDHLVTEEDLAGGRTVRDMSFPHGIRLLMVKREEKFLVPHGSMELFPGDHLMIIIGDSDD
ncbi:MAG: potassium/proton antiporter [Bacteroidales bacterium]|nr:potassium/proton antiporter [Bacteroidales bacterium]